MHGQIRSVYNKCVIAPLRSESYHCCTGRRIETYVQMGLIVVCHACDHCEIQHQNGMGTRHCHAIHANVQHHAFVDLRPKFKLIELLRIFLATLVLHVFFRQMPISAPEGCSIHAISAMSGTPVQGWSGR